MRARKSSGRPAQVGRVVPGGSNGGAPGRANPDLTRPRGADPAGTGPDRADPDCTDPGANPGGANPGAANRDWENSGRSAPCRAGPGWAPAQSRRAGWIRPRIDRTVSGG